MDRAIFFDLDGTIWDSWPWYARLLQEADGAHADGHLARLRDGSAAARLLRQADVTEARIRAFCSDGPPPLYPGAAQTVRRLALDGVRMGAVTNLPKWLYQPMLAAHQEFIEFDVVVGWGDGPRKPRPDPLWKAIDLLGLSPEGPYWYVGDTGGDCACAKAAGVRFAWASWGYAETCPRSVDQSLRRFMDIGSLE